MVVPAPGLEPGRPFEQRILSPLRLPIPPSGHDVDQIALKPILNG